MLIPFDDYLLHQTSEPLAHVGLGHPNQYDRFWFNGYTEDFFFAVALGIYPNRGIIDAAFGVVADGVQRSVFASGRIPRDRTETRVGPIAVRIVEPMREFRITIDAPDQGLGAELTARARTAVFEEERAVRNAGPRREWDYTRATQMIAWDGHLTSGSTHLDLDRLTVYGTKDRSWGVRPVGQRWQAAPEPQADQLFFMWAPLNFDDLAVHYMVHEDRHGEAWAQTAAVLSVIDGSQDVFGEEFIDPLKGVRHQIAWRPGLRRAFSAALTLEHQSGEKSAIDLEPLLAFRMKGAGYFHPTWAHGTWHGELVVGGEEADVRDLDVLAPDCLHVQQVVRATWGDRVGMGVLEQAVFGPYEPAGLIGAFDGVQIAEETTVSIP